MDYFILFRVWNIDPVKIKSTTKILVSFQITILTLEWVGKIIVWEDEWCCMVYNN